MKMLDYKTFLSSKLYLCMYSSSLVITSGYLKKNFSNYDNEYNVQACMLCFNLG